MPNSNEILQIVSIVKANQMEKLLNVNKNEAIENEHEMAQLLKFINTLSEKNIFTWLQNISSNNEFENNLKLVIRALPQDRWEKIEEALIDGVRVY